MQSKESHDALIAAAMRNLPTGAFICDREGIVQFINAAYANYLRLRPEEAVGRHITELIPDSGIPAVLRSGKAELRQIRRFPNGGSTLIVNRVPLFDKDGELIGALSMTLFDMADQVRELLEHVGCLDKKVNSCQRRIKSALSAPYSIESIVGESESIRTFKALLLRYAHTDAAVLILGDTGTGKELAASAIHSASSRADGPFVCINCAAIPKELFESEVFGYAPGAFSGARKEGSIGKIEMAHQGTLFLDEVGDLPLSAQAKLLRVLEEKRLFRLGSAQPRDVDFRLVAATNRDLRAMIAAGTFREDLWYRINSMKLCLPSLRERREDIPLLVRFFLDHMGAGETVCTEEAMKTLQEYSWPGNIRELRNAVGYALSLCSGGRIDVHDLPLEYSRAGRHQDMTVGSLQTVRMDAEGLAIEKILRETGGNKVKAAAILGISRAALYEKIKKLRMLKVFDDEMFTSKARDKKRERS
ncbi:sigma-54 interaction domain-containing protein [Desulfovibrio sp. SGI.169]|uniref:sigma-54 interaction domain-containing protein n=1 Tax=Desulfovibrio sp. SGI.169 TaxID=3420561 RepID=UPI003D021F1C